MNARGTIGLLVAGFLLACAGVRAQSRVEFGYDAAGNRIYRRVIVLDGGQRRAETEETYPADEEEAPEAPTESWLPASGRTVRIYPNPTHGRLLVRVDGALESGSLTVYSLGGARLHASSLQEGENILDLSGLDDGRYVLVLNMDGEKKEYVVVKK